MNLGLQKYVPRILYYGVLGWFTYLMLAITVQYIPIQFDVAFLRIKQDEIALVHYQWAFFTHVYTSIVVLIAGIFQFSNYVRTRYPVIHKNLGKVYVGLTLLLASPSGLVMGYYANGDIYSRISFMLLAVLWFYFTYKAFRHIKQGQFELHRKFMLRSFALTMSAISLRLIKWGLVSTLELPPMDTYKIVAWAGWVVNLAVLEVYFLVSKK